MRLTTDAIGLTALTLVLLAWLVFGLVFLLHKKTGNTEEAKRNTVSKWGIAIQSMSFALVWSLPRAAWWPFESSTSGEVVLAVVAVVLAYASSLFCLFAVRTLGKQWTYQARVIKGHELVTRGPYSIVRNPIYLGIFGLLIATGLTFSRWWTFAIAMICFLVGNHIRIRAEEQLLHETFGSAFEEYARRVPAFLPRLF